MSGGKEKRRPLLDGDLWVSLCRILDCVLVMDKRQKIVHLEASTEIDA